jgi:hypothetical protein
VDREDRLGRHRDVDRAVLLSLLGLPSRSGHSDLHLGHRPAGGREDAIISPAKDEQRISALLGLFDQLMDRCEATARGTGRNLLCWLKSTRYKSRYTKPFTFVSSASTTKKYRRLFKQCLAFALRGYRMDPELRERVLGNRFSRKQVKLMRLIWAHTAWASLENPAAASQRIAMRVHGDDKLHRADRESSPPGRASNHLLSYNSCRSIHTGARTEAEAIEIDDETAEATDICGPDTTGVSDDEDDEDGDDGDDDDDQDDEEDDDDDACLQGDDYLGDTSSFDEHTIIQSEDARELLEHLFRFVVSLCTQQLMDGKPSSTIPIYASGILGISPSTHTFYPARSYASFLSGLIYIQRLLFLELALPLRDYVTLGIPRYHDDHGPISLPAYDVCRRDI